MKKHYHNLKEILENIHNTGITSLQELQNDILLYHTFFNALNDYIEHVVFSIKGKYNKNTDRYNAGNKEKLYILNSYNFSNEDIQRDILIHIIEKCNFYLTKDPVLAIPYINKIATNNINDLLRKYRVCYSLDTPINNSSTNDNNDATMMELIPDNYSTPLPEEYMDAKEEIMYRYKKLTTGILLFNQHASESLSYIALNYLQVTPRELSETLIKKGHADTVVEIFVEISNTYNITNNFIEKLVKHISTHQINDLIRKLPTNDEVANLSKRISRLAYNGKQLVEKTVNKNKTINHSI